jgi:two-component system sensor histidine kinase AlgZ
LALDNVRERLSLLHDVQAQFQSGLKAGVFRVRIEVPA